MDIKVLEEYKKRLVNFSGRNQTLKRNKLYAKRAFDLKKSEKFEENITGLILNQILCDTDKEVTIVNKNKKIILEKNEIEKINKNYLALVKNSQKIKALYSKEEIEKILKNKDDKLILKIQKDLQEEKKENIKNELDNLFKNLDILKNEIETVEKETGLYQLYIGYPFIEGKLEDGTDVRAPLFLYPCKLEKKDGKFIYKNLNENSIYINRSFLLAYSNATRKDFKNLRDEYDTVQEIFSTEKKIETQEDYLKKCVEFLSKNEIHVNSYFEEEIESYKDYKKETYNKFSKGELYLKNYFIIGQYTIGDNGIYKDYETLCEKEDLHHEVVDNLLKYDKNAVYDEKELNTINEKNIKIDEKNSFFITELDYSQEKAIKMAEELKSLVIYGPPGTGKSQVIANIISDNLAKDKRILVVSEKRTALDVVYKRLEKCGLNERIGFVHDIKSDKKEILEKVVTILDSIEQQNNNENIYNGIENISEKIENRIKKLDNLKNILFEKQHCGISLYELYSNSKLKDEKLKEILNNFEKYDFFNNNELKEIIQKLENLKNGLVYDTLPIISKRKSFAEKSDLENIEIISKMQNVEKYYEENIENKLIENLKDIKDLIYTKLVQENKNEKEKFEENIKNKKDELLFLLKKETEKEKRNLEKEIFTKKEETLKKINVELNDTQYTIENLEKDLEKINVFDSEIYKNLDELDYKRKEYISLSFFSFLKKSKLKKELMRLNYGNTIEEKLKQIEEVKTLKESNEGVLNSLIFNLKCKNLNDLKRVINNKKIRIENLKAEIETSEDLKCSLEFSEEVNNSILELKKLEDYLIILSNLFTVPKEKIKEIENETIYNILNNLKSLEKEFEECIKNNIKYLNEIKSDFEEIKIDDVNNLIYFKNILKKYNFIKEAEKLEVFIEKIEKVFVDIQDIAEEFKISDEDIFIRFFKSQTSSFSETIKILDSNFQQIKDYDMNKSELNKKELIIFELFKTSENQVTFLKALKNTYYLKWIEYAEKQNNEILNDIQYFESIKNKSFDLIQEKKRLIPEYITEKWNRKIKKNFVYNRGHKEITYSDLRHESKKKRKVLSLRNYISRFKNSGLFDILPCWLLTPEVVSDILPLAANIFDIIIFDEASQIFVEKSIPAIYRAKSIVIAGDDKQLQPNSVAKKKLDKFDDIEGDFEDFEDEEFEENDTVALDEVSLLDVAQKMYKGSLLSYHYRSNYEELINFSNYAFYKGRLIVAPNKEDKNYIPIERIKVNGVWDKRKNLREAEETYVLVKNILKERKENESIGIVTFNEAQRELIRTYLEDQCEKDPEFSVLYLKEKIRHDDTEDKSIFVKNIENVQGDERDIIIFSIGYAKDIETGRVASRFGTLSQSGGENRLNVAISRAKKKIYVITSIEPEELMVETSKNQGPKLFKKYLEYVRAVSEGRRQDTKDILNSLFRMYDVKEENKIHFDSDFEKEVYTSLKNNNYEVHTQVGVSGYKIDLGIYSKEKSEYILGIECDGATYHSSPSARERDVYRQKFLESKGWTIHRIWSKDWWRDPEKEIRKIKNLLQNLA